MMETAFNRSRDADSIPYCPDGFALRKDGLYLLSTERNSEERISGPISVAAYTKDVVTGTFGFVLAWTDIDEEQQEAAFSKDTLHEQGSTLARALANRGLAITPGKERALLRYLGSFDAQKVSRVQATGRLGWLDDREGRLVYVLPKRTIQPNTDHPVFFQPEAHSPTVSTMHQRGTLEQWNNYIARVCAGNSYLLVALGTAFAAPLMRFARLESGGIHLCGRSSRGKTTAIQVAASVFGCGADPADAPDQSFVQRWNATANALEGLGAAHNDGILVLDEIHTCNAKDFGAVVYNLFGGKGKQTLTRDRNIRPTRTWRLLALSTGEISSQQKIEETSRNVRTGQLLRMIDLPINESVIGDTHGLEPGQFVRRLKRNCGTYYGTAGPAFIEALTNYYADAHELSLDVRDRMERHRDAFAFDLRTPEQQRVADRFCLIATACELATEMGIVDTPFEAFLAAAVELFRLWCASGADIADSVRGAMAVQAFIHRHQSRFVPRVGSDGSSTIRDIAGYTEFDDDDGSLVYLFTREGFEEATQGYNSKDVAREIQFRGFLIVSEGDRYQTKRKINNGRSRVYAVHSSVLEHEFVGCAGADGAHGAIV